MQTISTRSRIDRKSILLGSSALLVAMAVSGAAQAQCVNTLDSRQLGGLNPAQFLPLAQGGAVNSLVSVLNTTTTVFQAQTGSAFVSSPANAAPGENGGGIWGRVLGGSVETKNTGVTNVQIANATVGGNVTCNTTTRQDFVGYQVGRDIAKLNWDGWNLHAGATVGYMDSRSRDATAGGTFTSGVQVPFLGSYFTATKGGFFADALVRWDFYNLDLNDPASGLLGQTLNARGWSVGGNVGYNVGLPNNWFIEPSAGFTYSRVEVDPLNVAGTLFTTLPGFSLPGTVQVDDIKSELGRASLRIGTNIVTPTMALQPFVTGSVYHEFAGDVSTRITTNPVLGLGVPFTGTLTTDRVGTYGQISAGLAGQVLNTGWVGYARGDYRFGENIDGWTLNTGLRYQFSPEPLQAALSGKGLVYKAPPTPVAAPVIWRGFYVGLNAGTIWGKTDWDYVGRAPSTSSEPKYAGALLGGQAGYNYQIGAWVLGLEGDIAWSNAKGSAADQLGTFDAYFYSDETHFDWFATITGRLGYTWDRTLFFVKGGWAAAEVTQQTFFNRGYFAAGPATGPINGSSNIASGWTVGLGAEYALTATWSAKAEYLYYSLGTDRYVVDNALQVDAKESGGIARIGLNYRFSPVPAVPVMAKY
ncbi:autotransporter domain-containing protein [Rhodoplanes sp. SY1]